jgi:hypothetical protein
MLADICLRQMNTLPVEEPSEVTYVSVILPRLAEALREAADIYNQTAVRKVEVDGPSHEAETNRLEITMEELGFRFEDCGKGFVSVLEIVSGESREWARVEPQADPEGRLVAWRESILYPKKGTSTRSLDGLSQTYLLNLLRKRLLSKSPSQ